ncbi:hypothetical protein ACLMAL_26385 [Nocardia sp. CWNU-33]|uniref:WXG100-like domain-containing protein n=1 Tax=Nocardia sp. CWNU-33 TaxID=3392117 RepID=UPI00398F3218
MTLWFPQLPGPLGWLEDFLIGHWPEGDEDAMRRTAEHWSNMANALRELERPADQAMNTALSAIDGKIHDAMSTYWQDVAGGDGSDLQALINACDSFAQQLEHGATDIEYTKLSIYFSLAAMVAIAFVPGIGELIDVAAAAAVKLLIRKTVQELLNKLAVKGAMFLAERVGLEAASRLGANAASELAVKVGTQALGGSAFGSAFGAGTDLAAQGVQIAEGNREGLDLGSVGRSAGAGAVAGAVAGPIAAKSGESLASTLGTDLGSNSLSGVLTRAVGAVPGNIAGNTAAAASGGDIDFSTVADGAGAGFGRAKPHEVLPTHAETGPSGGTHIESPRESPITAGSEQPSTAPASTPANQTHTDTAPSSSTTHPEASASSAAATTTGVPDTPGQTSASAASHDNPTAPQPNSGSTGHSVDTRSNSSDSSAPPAGNTGGQSTPDRAPVGQAPSAATTTPTPDRQNVQGPATPASNAAIPGGDRPMPANTARTSTDIPQRPEGAPRSETPAPTDRGTTAQRPTETPRSPGSVDTPERTTATPPAREATGNTPRLDSGTHQPTDRTPTNGTGDRSPHPTPAASGPDSHPPGPRDTASPPRETAKSEHSPSADTGQRIAPRSPESVTNRAPTADLNTPGADRNTEPRSHRAPGDDPDGGPHRRAADPSDRPDGTERHPLQPGVRGTSTGGTGDHAPQVVAHLPSSGDIRGGSSTSGERRSDSPHPDSTDHALREAATPDEPGVSYSGGAVRPRDDFAAFEWADNAYDHFRGDDRDIADIASVLADHPRDNGAHFTHDDVQQIKNHLFREEHPIQDYDGSVAHRRYDADPDIAEAWIRLRSGRPDPADIVLLEHELAKSNYYRDNPGALYQEAHAHANVDHNWAQVAAPRSGERYDTLWGRHDGVTDLLQPNQDRPERGGIPVRGDEGQPRSSADDRHDEQHRPHGPTGGRDFPVRGGTDHAPGQTRESVAPERGNRLLADGGGERRETPVLEPVNNPSRRLDSATEADADPSHTRPDARSEHSENGPLATEHAPTPTRAPSLEPPPHRQGFDPAVHKYVARFDDGRLIAIDPFYGGEYNPHIGRYQPTSQEIAAARAHPPGESPHDIQVRNWLDAQQQLHPHDAAPESQPLAPHEPWRSSRAPESLPPTAHAPTHESTTSHPPTTPDLAQPRQSVSPDHSSAVAPAPRTPSIPHQHLPERGPHQAIPQEHPHTAAPPTEHPHSPTPPLAPESYTPVQPTPPRHVGPADQPSPHPDSRVPQQRGPHAHAPNDPQHQGRAPMPDQPGPQQDPRIQHHGDDGADLSNAARETAADLRRAQQWAVDAYNAIRNADDVGRIVSSLESARRPDGSRYTPSMVEAVKDYLFHQEHPLRATDGGLINARFEANPDIAEAWIRLRSGRFTDSDLLLLEHELVEHLHSVENPGASYADSHRAANEVANWERGRLASSPEDYTWDGPVHENDRSHAESDSHLDGRRPVPGQSGSEMQPPGGHEPNSPYQIPGETNNRPDPAIPERDNLTPPAGMYRGDDGCLRMPGDPLNSWRDREKGRLHDFSDPPGVFRDKNYNRHDEQGFARNPDLENDKKIVFPAIPEGPKESYKVKDEEIAKKIQLESAERLKQQAARDPAAQELARLIPKFKDFGISEVRQLKDSELGNGVIEKLEKQIREHPNLSPTEKLERLTDVRDLENNARIWNAQGVEMVNTSKGMGDLGGDAYFHDKEIFPDGVQLTPFEGAADGRDMADRLLLVPKTDATPTKLINGEHKGVGSELGSANTEHGRAQQMSPEHTSRTLAIDRNLITIFNETPAQMKARGLDPNSPEGIAYVKARDELIQAHRDGTLVIENHKVHVDINGNVSVTKYSQERYGEPVPVLILGGIERPPVRLPQLVVEVERELVREHALGNARILEGLSPREREVVDLVTELARDNRMSDSLAAMQHFQMRESLETINQAVERGLSLEERSQLVAAAKARLIRMQELELARSLELVQRLDLGSDSAVIEKILELDIVARDIPVIANIEAANREIVKDAQARVLEYRDPQMKERSRFIAHVLEQVREMDKAFTQGKEPDLAMVRANHDLVQDAIKVERENEARALDGLGLDPGHARQVTESIEAVRARNLELAREEFAREIVRQEHNRTVGDSQVLQLSREQVRTMDLRTYALCLELEPTGFDPQSRTFTYEPPGQPPVRVPYDSMARRNADVIKAIERGTPVQTVEVDLLVSASQGRTASESVSAREREDDRQEAQRRVEMVREERAREQARAVERLGRARP